MMNRIIAAIAATLTTILFGAIGFMVGIIIALSFNGLLTLSDSATTFSLLKSGCVGFAAGAITAITALITDKK